MVSIYWAYMCVLCQKTITGGYFEPMIFGGKIFVFVLESLFCVCLLSKLIKCKGK